MAFNISNSCKAQGITLASMYVRLTAEVNAEGNKVRVKADWYNDKAAYKSSKYNMLPVEIAYTEPDKTVVNIKIENVKEFAYNRESDSADILQFAHDKYKGYLNSIPSDREEKEYKDKLMPATKISKVDLT